MHGARARGWLWAGLVLLLLALLGARSRAAEPVLPLGLGAAFDPGHILHGITPHRLIHFTFDDGPDAQGTPRLLDELDAARIKATFFFSASRFRDHSQRNAHARELALEVRRRGHGIGSHSVDHRRMRSMTPAQLREQLDASDRLFTEIFGVRTYLFRPPWGSHNGELDRMLAERSDTMVLWNIGSADWVIDSAPKLTTTLLRALPYLERTKGWGGGIILMHDTHPWTIEAFPQIVQGLRARNCELLAGNEELYDIVDDLSLFRTSDAASDRALPELLAARQHTLREQTRTRCGSAHR
jgi:peptidoglycan/xylan/chitin deacetylase (PgdA/CDA1 family)